MMKRLVGLCLLAALLLVACGEDNEPTRPNDFVPLTAITVTSQYPQIAAGTSNQFRAIGDFSGAFTRDITDQVAWSSDNPTVLEISNDAASHGLGKGLAAGTTNITATSGTVTGTFGFTVTDATASQVAVTPATANVSLGLTQQFTATGSFNDALVPTQDITRDVIWTSADDTIATVNATGLATAVAAGGPIDITADFGGVTGSASVTVTEPELQSITLTPAAPVLTNGETQQFTATGNFSDGTSQDVTSQATWSSSDSSIATIDDAGLATAVRAGTVTIAAFFNGVRGTTTLTVTALTSIVVTPTSQTIAVGGVLQMTATGNFTGAASRDITSLVTWTSSNNNVATVSATGQVQGVNPGSVTIRAGRDGQTGTATVVVQ